MDLSTFFLLMALKQSPLSRELLDLQLEITSFIFLEVCKNWRGKKKPPRFPCLFFLHIMHQSCTQADV